MFKLLLTALILLAGTQAFAAQQESEAQLRARHRAAELASMRLSQVKDQLKARRMLANPSAFGLAYDILLGHAYKRELELLGLPPAPTMIWVYLEASLKTRAFVTEIVKTLGSDLKIADVWLEPTEKMTLEDLVGGLNARMRSHQVLILSNLNAALEHLPTWRIEEVVKAIYDHMPTDKTILIVDDGPALEKFAKPEDVSDYGVNFVASGHGYMLATVTCAGALLN